MTQPALTVTRRAAWAPWAYTVRGKEMVRMADEAEKRNCID